MVMSVSTWDNYMQDAFTQNGFCDDVCKVQCSGFSEESGCGAVCFECGHEEEPPSVIDVLPEEIACTNAAHNNTPLGEFNTFGFAC